jgi:NADH dehydrogenase
MTRIAHIPVPQFKRIVIVGAGFAGLKLARSLFNSGYQVVIIDKNNYHQFQPLFYQVATAGLESSAISFPLRILFQKQKRFHFRIAELLEVHPESKIITTSIGELEYDYLAIAAGGVTNFFGNKNIENQAFTMKSVSDAILIRNTILGNYEKALNQTDPEDMAAYLNMVIVGGGPTGVEMAGALAEMKKYILPKDYPELDFDLMKIHLFEASGNLLGGMSEKSGAKAQEYLKKLDVDVRLHTQVTDASPGKVMLKDGTVHKTHTLIWAAGVKAITINGIPVTSIGHGGRILVDEYNRVQELKDVFVLGDNCLIQNETTPKGHPQVAQVAIQQAKNLAKNLINEKTGQSWQKFVYKDKGSLATIGHNLAVADLPGMHFDGFPAWVLWSAVHLMSIIGVKNRFFIMWDWIWNYFSYNQTLRLMIRPKIKKEPAE